MANDLFKNLEEFSEIREYDAWYKELITIFEKANCSEELLSELKKLDSGPLDSFEKYTCVYENPFEGKKFFEYISTLQFDKQYLEDAIKYALKNIRVFGTLIVSFINYIVITKFDDIEVDCDIEKLNNEPVKVICKLGDYEVCSMLLLKTSKGICFDEVKTKLSLLNNNIGTLMFVEVAKKIKEHFSEDSLYATNVYMYNYGGMRFYERLGAKLEKNSGDDFYKCVLDATALEKISAMTVKTPELYPTKNIYVDNPNVEIKKYLQNLIISQREYTSKGTVNIPKNIVTPQEILLSRTVVEKMINDETIECYGAGDDTNTLKFIWNGEKSQRFTVEICRTKLGDYELTKFIELCGCYEKVFYDINEDIRRRGILTVSSVEDDISDVYKLS